MLLDKKLLHQQINQEGPHLFILLLSSPIEPILARAKKELIYKKKREFAEFQPLYHRAEYRREGLKLRDNSLINSTQEGVDALEGSSSELVVEQLIGTALGSCPISSVC